MTVKERNQVESEEVLFFAKYYEDQAYNPTGWRLRLQRELRSLLRQANRPKLGRVLSLGCGDGQFELMLAPYAEHVTGLDISPEAIDIANRQAAKGAVTNVGFRCQALSELDWSETYDVIVCLAFLHHVPPAELSALFQQVYDHLAPHGLFYAEDPNIHGVLRRVGRVILGSRYDRYHSPDERELDPAEIRSMLEQTGFHRVGIGYIDVALIPGLFVMAKGPTWPMYAFTALDWIWCHSPFASLASGFTTAAWKPST
jgi:2-polyprenyl-3-methyl-5-hydroxy-6-metoxy-1,4-benzoquinol methylase